MGMVPPLPIFRRRAQPEAEPKSEHPSLFEASIAEGRSPDPIPPQGGSVIAPPNRHTIPVHDFDGIIEPEAPGGQSNRALITFIQSIQREIDARKREVQPVTEPDFDSIFPLRYRSPIIPAPNTSATPHQEEPRRIIPRGFGSDVLGD